MNPSHHATRVYVPLDVIADAHRLADVLAGVHGRRHHLHGGRTVEATRGAALEARAITTRIAADLDAITVINLAEQRTVQRAREGK